MSRRLLNSRGYPIIAAAHQAGLPYNKDATS